MITDDFGDEEDLYPAADPSEILPLPPTSEILTTEDCSKINLPGSAGISLFDIVEETINDNVIIDFIPEKQPEYPKESDLFSEEILIRKFRCKFCKKLFDSPEHVKTHFTYCHSNQDNNKDINSLNLENEDEKITKKGIKTSKKTKVKRKTIHRKIKYPCEWPECSYVAGNIYHLKNHQKLHTGEKPFRCNWNDCSMSFTQASALRTHMRTHTGERPYECQYCMMTFNQAHNLKIHIRIHTGERPFKCEWPGCEASFKHKGNLESHRKHHCGDKRFQCDYIGCVSSFVSRSQLKRHQMIHTGEKPFKCDRPNCSYSSNRRFDVNKHKLSHMKKSSSRRNGEIINDLEF